MRTSDAGEARQVAVGEAHRDAVEDHPSGTRSSRWHGAAERARRRPPGRSRAGRGRRATTSWRRRASARPERATPLAVARGERRQVQPDEHASRGPGLARGMCSTPCAHARGRSISPRLRQPDRPELGGRGGGGARTSSAARSGRRRGGARALSVPDISEDCRLARRGRFAGKRGLVLGVANRRSIAWAIAKQLADGGAQLAFTFQGERIEKNVRELAETVDAPLVTAVRRALGRGPRARVRRGGRGVRRRARPARALGRLRGRGGSRGPLHRHAARPVLDGARRLAPTRSSPVRGWRSR